MAAGGNWVGFRADRIAVGGINQHTLPRPACPSCLPARSPASSDVSRACLPACPLPGHCLPDCPPCCPAACLPAGPVGQGDVGVGPAGCAEAAPHNQHGQLQVGGAGGWVGEWMGEWMGGWVGAM